MATDLRRKLVGLVITGMLACLIAGAAQAEPIPSRAVSLNALSSAMKSGRMTDAARSLCGITRMSGYVVDSKSKDIVLVGKVDSSLPPLELDDFVVALRNVWLTYARVSGRVRYYSDPGCSIDPAPRVLGQLRDLQSEALNLSDAQAVDEHYDHWREVARQAQSVRVMGVPFDSHFAKVMVDADYYMKRLVNGSVALDIPGFVSLSDLSINELKAALRSGDDSSVPMSSMNRFWFSPGDVTYEDSDGCVILKSCTVRLLTEEELLTEQGTISGKGRPDPLADQFARSFTLKYDDIAAQRPIYKQLRGLFAFAAVARLMKDGRADKTAPGAFSYLLKSHKVATTPVSRAVNGLTDVRHISEPVDTPQGQRVSTMVQSTCGGVSMSVRPKRVGVAKKTSVVNRSSVTAAPGKSSPVAKTSAPAKASRTASSLKHVVLSSKKSPNALSWDVPAQFD